MDQKFFLDVESHRTALLRYARLQLRNDTWAEDVVSEVILVACEKPESFGERSSLKTWLVGILKFKILDKFRANSKEVLINAGDDEDGAVDLEGLIFKADGHYAEQPADWGNPEATLQSADFFKVMEACTEKLPALMGRLFLMREWLELSVEEICKELTLTPTNFYVQLHRARLRLRECLQLNWFGDQSH